MNQPIIINIEKLVDTLNVSSEKISNAKKIKDSITDALLKAINEVRLPLKDFTKEPQETFKLNAKEIWSDNEMDFKMQIEKLKSETPKSKKVVILKHYIAICFTSS